MKKVYSNPVMDVYCVGSEMLTGFDIRGSQESGDDNITFTWGGRNSV